MPEPLNDPQFADIALRLKFLTDTQLVHCRDVQAQMYRLGFPATLQEIALRKRLLGAEQLRQIQRALGIPVGKLPGYTILQKIARGGMGIVYKARQQAVDRTVAIKVLSSLLTDRPQFVKRFMNEARGVAKLSHRNIVSVYDAGEANGVYYFVMEYVEGKDLSDLVDESGPFSEENARGIALQAAEALRYIHGKGLVHLDIKPENLILGRDGIVKLADFGLAKMPTNITVTDPTSPMGTPGYISPEQVKGEENIDIRSDLYSLGATMYFLLTGVPPYDGKNSVAIALKHLNEPVPDPRARRPEVSKAMAYIVGKLMQKDRAERVQTPAQLIDMLLEMRPASEAPPSEIVVPTSEPSKKGMPCPHCTNENPPDADRCSACDQRLDTSRLELKIDIRENEFLCDVCEHPVDRSSAACRNCMHPVCHRCEAGVSSSANGLCPGCIAAEPPRPGLLARAAALYRKWFGGSG